MGVRGVIPRADSQRVTLYASPSSAHTVVCPPAENARLGSRRVQLARASCKTTGKRRLGATQRGVSQLYGKGHGPACQHRGTLMLAY